MTETIITDESRALGILRKIVLAMGDKSLITQLEGVSLTREALTPMFFDIHVDARATRSTLRGDPLTVEMSYTLESGEKGWVLVFLKIGRLSWMEAPWYSSDMPQRWPSVEERKLYVGQSRSY